jgi:hypothetical protein
MAIGGTYNTGTVSVTNGSPTIPGSGVLWVDVIEGDWIAIGTSVAVIDSVSEDFGTITLKDNWAGSTAAGTAYRILKMSWLRYDPSLTQATLRTFIANIQNAGLFLFVEGSTPDPSMGEDGQYALKTNSPGAPWILWLKVEGAWVLQGSPAGTNWRGVWNGATAYVIGDSISRAGSIYIAIQPSTNAAPEANPLYWDVELNSGGRYDIATWSSLRPDGGEVLNQMVMSIAVTFYAGLVQSQARAGIAATATSVFSLQKNGVQFGTVTFAASGTAGTFAAASDTSFAAGDIFSVVAPNPRDNTLSGISLTVAGFR